MSEHKPNYVTDPIVKKALLDLVEVLRQMNAQMIHTSEQLITTNLRVTKLGQDLITLKTVLRKGDHSER